MRCLRFRGAQVDRRRFASRFFLFGMFQCEAVSRNVGMMLAEVPVKGVVRVVGVAEDHPNAARLMSLGLIAGQELEVLRRAPLGDPIHIRLMRHELCIRTEDARSVIVEASN